MKLKISAQAAAILRQDTSRKEKLKAAQGKLALSPSDLIAVLLYLSRDSDTEVKYSAVQTLRELDEDIVISVCSNPDTHPTILDVIARAHFANSSVTGLITGHPSVAAHTLAFLSEHSITEAHKSPAGAVATAGGQGNVAADPGVGKMEVEEEEFKSKYQLVQDLQIKDKIKLAMTGDKEWRSLLIKDNNRLVSEAVLKNPRITEQEIIMICKSSVNNDELLRIICTDKEWTQNYQIRKSLIENHRTPLNYALRFLSFLTEKDLSFLAKSKNVSSVVTTQARRMLTNKNSCK